MAQNKKWRIKDLSTKAPFCDAAKIVLGQRLSVLMFSIKRYFDENTAENLHEIRISLRRLRYTMEIFYDCFSAKKFMPLYKNIEYLQDLSGAVRDLDVLKENIQSITGENKISVPQKFLTKIDTKKDELTRILKLELMKFYHSKRVKKFI